MTGGVLPLHLSPRQQWAASRFWQPPFWSRRHARRKYVNETHFVEDEIPQWYPLGKDHYGPHSLDRSTFLGYC